METESARSAIKAGNATTEQKMLITSRANSNVIAQKNRVARVAALSIHLTDPFVKAAQSMQDTDDVAEFPESVASSAIGNYWHGFGFRSKATCMTAAEREWDTNYLPYLLGAKQKEQEDAEYLAHMMVAASKQSSSSSNATKKIFINGRQCPPIDFSKQQIRKSSLLWMKALENPDAFGRECMSTQKLGSPRGIPFVITIVGSSPVDKNGKTTSFVEGKDDNNKTVRQDKAICRHLGPMLEKAGVLVFVNRVNTTTNFPVDKYVGSNRYMGNKNIHMLDPHHFPNMTKGLQNMNLRNGTKVCFVMNDYVPTLNGLFGSNFTFTHNEMFHETKVGDTLYVRIPHFSALWCVKLLRNSVNRPYDVAKKMFEIIIGVITARTMNE